MPNTTINTKEQLREYVHSIHDYIRNSGAGYNMTALKIFNVFYSLKILEGQLEKYGLSKNCDWKYLRDNLNEGFDTFIYNAVNELRNICLNDNKGKHPLMDFIREIYDDVGDILENKKNKDLIKIMEKLGEKIDDSENDKSKILINISHFIYHQIPNGLPHSFCKELFNKVDDLPFNKNDKNFDIKGKIYEYFIGRDKSAISDMGAYFTDRYLTNFIMEELSPECIDGEVPLMIDMFGGSGGMTLSYVEYIKNKYDIKWDEFDNYKKIHHCDMSEDVVKIAAVEFYSLTGFFPDKDTQFIRCNSFKREFEQKYKYIISNPPYGGDKTDKTPEIIKKETIVDYNKNQIEKIKSKLGIETKDFNQLTKKITNNYKKNDIIDIENNNILDIGLFKAKVKELTKDFYEGNNELDLIMLVRLIWQNIIFKIQIEEEVKNGLKHKVNYDTCSDLIKKYSKDIIYDYDKILRKQYIQKIDKELLTESNKVKIQNLTKYKIQLQNELKTKYKTNNIESKNINFNDKESCSLILLMKLLDNDGECVGVLKEGVFFDSKYSKLRCFLINNFNVSDIYSIDSAAFENTSTKTSIIRFKNNGKTKEINFWNIDVVKNQVDKIEYDEKYGNDIIEPINQIIKVNKVKICTATFEQLSNINIKYNNDNKPSFDMNYSLHGKDYEKDCNKNEIICGKDYELKKLSDICEFKKGKYLSKDNFKEGNIPVIGGGISPIGFHNEYNMVENTILCSSLGNNAGYISKYNTKVWVSSCFAIIPNKTIIPDYIYYMLKIRQDDIFKVRKGSAQPYILSSDLEKHIQIPIPKSKKKMVEWADKISAQYNAKIKKQTQIKELETFVQNRIREIGENEDCDEVKLGDISDINMGTTPSTKNHNYWDKGTIPWVSVTELNNNIIYDTIKHITKEGELTMKNRKIPINSILLSFNMSIGKLAIAGVEMYCNQAIVYLNSKIKNIHQMYLYYTLENMDLEKYGRGTIGTHGNLNKEILTNLQIKIPKNKQLIQDLESTFEQIETLKTEVKNAEELYNNFIQELSQEAIPQQQIIKSNNESSDENNEVDELDEEEEVDEEEVDEEEVDEEDDEEVDKEVDEEDDEEVDEVDDEEDDEEEYDTVEYKDKLYILEGDKLYKINEDDTKGKIFGSYIDGKVKKIKQNKVSVI